MNWRHTHLVIIDVSVLHLRSKVYLPRNWYF